MRSKKQIKATLKALEKLKDLDSVRMSNLKNDYGELWAAIFDDLHLLKVVGDPYDEVKIVKNYIAPAQAYLEDQLKDCNRLKCSDIRSWIATAISIAAFLLSLLTMLL